MEYHSKIKEKLCQIVENKKIPHIIFHGPSGSGKRTLLQYFIKKIYDDCNDKIRQYVMYVNCAHSKGIRFIRDQLKFFAKTNIQNKKGFFFKSIILFNAEKLTIDAQSALRRCIEKFSHTTRFFIIVEHKNKLLKPIQSRFCSIYVPRPIINGYSINLHDKESTKKQNFKWIIAQFKTKSNFESIINCKNLATKIYEKGIHVLNIFDIIEEEVELENKYLFLLYFDRLRAEFRNEKLLIFLILFFVFMRPKLDLENIEIM